MSKLAIQLYNLAIINSIEKTELCIYMYIIMIITKLIKIFAFLGEDVENIIKKAKAIRESQERKQKSI